jgi:hypothetical protein
MSDDEFSSILHVIHIIMHKHVILHSMSLKTYSKTKIYLHITYEKWTGENQFFGHVIQFILFSFNFYSLYAKNMLFIGFSIHKYILLDTKINLLCQLEAGIWLKQIFSSLGGGHFEFRP